MAKIVRPICCGADIHKNFIVATIATVGAEQETTHVRETFTTLNSGLGSFCTWLLNHQCYEVCMESTGKYWIPIFNVLEEAGIHVCLTHPKYTRAIKGQKTDPKDSKWIADLFQGDYLHASYIPCKMVREWRELARYRTKLVYMRSSERNRYQNCLTTANIGLGSVLSNTLGKTAKDIVGYILSTSTIDEEYLVTLIQRTARKKTKLILESIRGHRLDREQRFKMREARAHMEYLDQSITRTEDELYKRMEPYEGLIEGLAQIPGISKLSAALILAEIGVDMTVWDSSKKLVSWAGLAPTNNESAGKKKSVRISRAGQYLKPVLVQCALAAIRDKKNPYFAIKYRQIKVRRGHNRAIIAIARMMLTCIYHMISSDDLVFMPKDYDEVINSTGVHRFSKPLNEEIAIAFLAAQGYDVSTLAKKLE